MTVHDGFTLADLVSYEHKHNEANGEDNRDGSDDNLSTNCGAEGPTDDPRSSTCGGVSSQSAVHACFWRRACRCCSPATRSATARTATTTPIAKTTRSAGSIGLSLGHDGEDMTALDRPARGIAQALPAASGLDRWLEGRRPDGSYDVLWLTPDANEMTEQDWNFPNGRFLSYVLGARAWRDRRFHRLQCGAGGRSPSRCRGSRNAAHWTAVLDTACCTAGARASPRAPA